MISAYNALGQAIFQTLARSEGNVVISPLSIGMTLAMGFAGAAGETAEEMARVLMVDAARADFCRANADLLRHYAENTAPEAPMLCLANALVLTQHGEAVAKSYRELLAESFAAEIFQGDVADVNRWVAQKTQHKIERVLDTLPPDDIAVLVNAVYFKAPWAQPFNPTSTSDRSFFLSAEEEIEVKTMHIVGDYVMARRPGYHAALLPYKAPSLNMIVVLPDEDYGLDAVLDAFDVAELAQLRAAFASEPSWAIVLELPRFRAQTEASLKPALQLAGMSLAFDWRRADFSAMTERTPAEIPVAISDIRHCALIDVTEEGTEAAGATLVLFHIGGASPEFIVNRPFLFFILDETTGSILFQGKIVDPR
jgi:serpin B